MMTCFPQSLSSLHLVSHNRCPAFTSLHTWDPGIFWLLQLFPTKLNALSTLYIESDLILSAVLTGLLPQLARAVPVIIKVPGSIPGDLCCIHLGVLDLGLEYRKSNSATRNIWVVRPGHTWTNASVYMALIVASTIYRGPSSSRIWRLEGHPQVVVPQISPLCLHTEQKFDATAVHNNKQSAVQAMHFGISGLDDLVWDVSLVCDRIGSSTQHVLMVSCI